ncbi:hypothetical protein C0991_009633 [Blastosporella zonata]|nr:hypothetical protein C0991_009633 [Blastosporella zonata]
MAALLIVGAIPSALTGTAHSASTLYTLRFFIGVLGGTFVPCQAWTSAFFDKNCVGTVNALVGGWGNMGGGATFAIMTSLYATLRSNGMTQHVAWRVSFAIVPAPCLITVAILILVCGQDHPAGRWSERHNFPANTPAEKHTYPGSNDQHPEAQVGIHPGGVHETAADVDANMINSTVDVAVNEVLTSKAAARIISNPLTWLPALAYLTTFGLELTIDQMAGVLFQLFNERITGFDQTQAAYYTSILYVNAVLISKLAVQFESIILTVACLTLSRDPSVGTSAIVFTEHGAHTGRNIGCCSVA